MCGGGGGKLWGGGACNRRLEWYFLPGLYCTSFFFEDPSMQSPSGLSLPCLGPSCPSLQGCFGPCAFPEPWPLLSFSCDLSGPTLPSVWGAPASLPSSLQALPPLFLFLVGAAAPIVRSQERDVWLVSGHWSLVVDCRVGDLSPKESRCCGKLCPWCTVHGASTRSGF